MMKNDKQDHAVSIVLRYLLHLLIVAAFYWIMILTTIHFWLHTFIIKLSKVRYQAGPNFTKQLYLILLIYTLFCYVANNFMLDIYHRKTAKQFIISNLVDFLLLPFELFLMIMYKNHTHVFIEEDISVVYNIYLITGLLIIKNAIAVALLSPKKAVN